MKKLMIGVLALVAAMAFAGGQVAISAEGMPSEHHEQAQMAPESGAKSGTTDKQAQAKNKKAKKSNKAKKQRKSTQPEN